VTLLSGLWGLANPVFAGPDEPSHVIRAVALDHGHVFGKEPTGRLDRDFRRVKDSARVVQAPEIYRSVSGPPCFALHLGVAACLNFTGSSRNTDVVTYVTDEPPAYYAAVGLVSWLFSPGSLTVYLMRFLGTLMTGAFIATAITALRRSTAPQLLSAGLLLAITPMVLFMSSVVNPSAPEIAASLAFWACGLVLLSQKQERKHKWLITATGVAGCVLALSRPLGPLWVALIALTLVAVTSRAALRNLAGSTWARLWGALILLASTTQIVWDVLVRPRDATLVNRKSVGLAVIEPLHQTGNVFRWYREMIGWFGWLDTQSPVLTWLPWTAAVAFLFFVALVWVDRRRAFVLLALLAAVIFVPAVVERILYEAAETYWQGRYILPLAVGIPLVAAFALAKRAREMATPRLMLTIGIVVVVAQFLAFAQNLRRYTVGYDGELLFWKKPEWLPPLPPLLLTVAYAAAIVAFVWWLLVAVPAGAEPTAEVSAASSRTEPR
jgi:Predicted membrane protein (DUF2142)